MVRTTVTPKKRGRPTGTKGIRWKNRAEQEVFKYTLGSDATSSIINRGSFCRLVAKLVEGDAGKGFRFESSAMTALHSAAEAFLVEFFTGYHP